MFAELIRGSLGHGTSIKLYLPRAITGATPAISDESTAPETHHGGREIILVVEDDAAVRTVAVKILESIGYRVQQAADGRAALEILQQPGKIDLLFTDLIMPNGISGQDLMRMARQCRPGLKAIFTSGYSEQFLKGRDETDRSVPLLPKPYRRQNLIELIRKVLEATA